MDGQGFGQAIAAMIGFYVVVASVIGLVVGASLVYVIPWIYHHVSISIG